MANACTDANLTGTALADCEEQIAAGVGLGGFLEGMSPGVKSILYDLVLLSIVVAIVGAVAAGLGVAFKKVFAKAA